MLPSIVAAQLLVFFFFFFFCAFAYVQKLSYFCYLSIVSSRLKGLKIESIYVRLDQMLFSKFTGLCFISIRWSFATLGIFILISVAADYRYS